MHLTNPIYNRMALNIHTEKIDSYRAEDRSNSKTKARHALLIYNGRKHGDHTPIEDHCNLKNLTGTEIIEALITKSTTSKKPGEPGRDLDFLTAFQNKNIPGHILERTRKYLHLQQSLIEMSRTTRAKTPAGWKHPTTSTLNLTTKRNPAKTRKQWITWKFTPSKYHQILNAMRLQHSQTGSLASSRTVRNILDSHSYQYPQHPSISHRSNMPICSSRWLKLQ